MALCACRPSRPGADQTRSEAPIRTSASVLRQSVGLALARNRPAMTAAFYAMIERVNFAVRMMSNEPTEKIVLSDYSASSA